MEQVGLISEYQACLSPRQELVSLPCPQVELFPGVLQYHTLFVATVTSSGTVGSEPR